MQEVRIDDGYDEDLDRPSNSPSKRGRDDLLGYAEEREENGPRLVSEACLDMQDEELPRLTVEERARAVPPAAAPRVLPVLEEGDGDERSCMATKSQKQLDRDFPWGLIPTGERDECARARVGGRAGQPPQAWR